MLIHHAFTLRVTRMTSIKPASWVYAEDFAAEPEHIEAARRVGESLGTQPMALAAGAVLRMLAATAQARHVVEVGTGAGASGLWLLAGMSADGILTSIDVSHEYQSAARTAFTRAGHPPQRTRLICGDALEVLPRLTDSAYDLVLIDADTGNFPNYAEQAVRLLRSGGVAVFDHMLFHDQVAEPTARDGATNAMRLLGKQLRDDERLMTSLFPVSDGLLLCVKR